MRATLQRLFKRECGSAVAARAASEMSIFNVQLPTFNNQGGSMRLRRGWVRAALGRWSFGCEDSFC